MSDEFCDPLQPKLTHDVPASTVLAAAALFRALGDPGRLETLIFLRRREVCVGDLAVALDEKVSTVSQRLRWLRSDGLVDRQRRGKHVYYRFADAHVEALMEIALEHVTEERGHEDISDPEAYHA